MKNKIVYTGSFNFPNRDAAAARVLGNAKVFRTLGYNVLFFGVENEERKEDLNAAGKYYYDGFEYFSVNRNNINGNLLKNYFNKGKNVFENIENIKNEVHSVVLYNSNTFFTRRAIKFCKLNNINLILDLTEWYDGSHLPFGKFGPINLDNQYRMRYLNHKVKNIIVISDYLQSYYSKPGTNLIKIPPLVDFEDKKWDVLKKNCNESSLEFSYAGTPGNKNYFGKLKEKDLLSNFIKAISLLKKKGEIRVKLSVYGLKEADFLSFYEIESLGLTDSIKCYGRINQEDIPNHLIKSDYSVLLRPIKKYTKAGFSTKLVESLSSGLPVLTNKNHGDVDNIINKNQRGLLIDSYEVEDILIGIECLIEEGKDIHFKRSIEAKKYAKFFFDYRNKIDSFKIFFNFLN